MGTSRPPPRRHLPARSPAPPDWPSSARQVRPESRIFREETRSGTAPSPAACAQVTVPQPVRAASRLKCESDGKSGIDGTPTAPRLFVPKNLKSAPAADRKNTVDG